MSTRMQAASNQKPACSNQLFDIFLSEVKDPSGKCVSNYLIVEPKKKTKNRVTGVAILPVVNKRFALLKMYRPALDEEVWEVPRGFVELGEAHDVSVSRELEEETGICCQPQAVQTLGYMTPEAGILSARIHLFYANADKQKNAFIPNEFGHLEMRLFDQEELERMIQEGQIQDACTLICYYRYREYSQSV